MPTYSYACTACEHRFDTKQSFTDASLTDCPECSGRLRKLFSPVGVVFKGSGFYRTDSRAKAPSESGAGAKPGAETKEEAKSGSKPDTTSAAKPDAKSGSGSSDSSSGSAGSARSTGNSSGSAASSSGKSSSASSNGS